MLVRQEQIRKQLQQFAITPLQDIAVQIAQFSLPDPFLSDALLFPIIHSHGYVLPTSVSIEEPEEVACQRLVDAYDALSYLELCLRRLIELKRSEAFGHKWWKVRVPDAVQTDCETRKTQHERPGNPVY